MRKFLFAAEFFGVMLCWLSSSHVNAQTVKIKLQNAFHQFESDAQLKHAISSLYVINAMTGQIVFEKNSQVGLAPASTQKIITAATAFELLGRDYRYKTELGYNGKIENGVLKGNLYIAGYGDPTLGSWRFSTTIDTVNVKSWVSDIQKKQIRSVEGRVVGVDNNFESQTTPDGWIWQDIGNYYGAGVSGLNWHENQYDLRLSAGRKEGDSVKIVDTYPKFDYDLLVNELKTGSKGSGDNAYIYLPPYCLNGFVRGTIPLGENRFTISGSLPMPSKYPPGLLADKLKKNGVSISDDWPVTGSEYVANRQKITLPSQIIRTYYSPRLDSIVYWFLQKSINLYGEALIKTFAYQKKGFGSTDTGVLIVKNFWKQKGVDPDELNIKDGSGLSPQNRVTTHAQVEVLKYAKKQSWFPYFFAALPEFNNMKMKSGTITDVKGFCGYHTSGDGTQYIFSFLVNNYSGSNSALVQKMYRVLDVLK
ncbi:MAG TPA: D-alanyl-D-alanine carboxypeptidase/D-alanyl-D-alanine-endopeptidase [Chitinophagaceae bacterium]|nr:D-alanyl-D-alanine carboxypeptidase/D-alanyl-D-alanine-endopeptidase [Chitinophagaceae bacterium]